MLIMNNKIQKEKQEILTLRIKNNIEKKDWEKLIAAIPIAEEIGIDKKLLLKSYLLLGDYYNYKKIYSDAIIYYFKVISILSDESVYIKLVSSLNSFYNLFESSFSKSDLQYLQTSLRFLYNKTSLYFPNSLALQSELKSILSNAKDLEVSTAKESIESPATYQVNKIYNNFYRPKNPQEVFERFSEVILPGIRPLYDEESKKEPDKKKKKKKNKKK